MQIPAPFQPLTTTGPTGDGPLEHTTTALYFDEAQGFTIQVTHQTADQTLVQIREGRVEGFDFQNRETIRDYGWHRTPAAAFRFLEAYLADGGDDWRSSRRYGGSPSPRYSRAVDAAYARR